MSIKGIFVAGNAIFLCCVIADPPFEMKECSGPSLLISLFYLQYETKTIGPGYCASYIY